LSLLSHHAPAGKPGKLMLMNWKLERVRNDEKSKRENDEEFKQREQTPNNRNKRR